MSIRIVVDYDDPDEEVQALAIAKAIPALLPVGLAHPQPPIVAVRNHKAEEFSRDQD